ncbi:MAG: hypothetical protein HDS38_06875 [Bacteroides sp.]|nr:hypothetical protein [Bacteroides sp.]
MKRNTNTYIPIIVGLIFTCTLGLFFVSCKNPTTCDGKECQKKLGLKGKTSVRDSLFRLDNPMMANQFNVFVESSASMDGYVTGYAFKTTLHRLMSQVATDVLINNKNLSLNYINSDILKQPGDIKDFTKSLSPTSFSNAGGDRANSDIIEIIAKVVNSTKKGSISMFVSDCVYSPESSDDIHKALKIQQTEMLNILKNKSKDDKSFGVLMYRLMSDFNGIYYTKTNGHIHCAGNRPFFVWFFGDESILAKVHKSVSNIMKEEKADYIVGIPGYEYMPYKTSKSSHPYHYLNAESKDDSIFTFNFIADLSPLPLTNDYITNKENYILGKSRYYIKRIEKITPDAKKGNYNYKFAIGIRGGKNSAITPTTVEISLASELKNIPQWVIKYDDPTGNDYDNGYNPQKLRTFGLKSLVEGIADFYNEPSYVTFRIQIN